MSHAIYQTPAIILRTKNMRESNKLIMLYTQKFGLVYGTLQSVRELKSKMRYHTHRLSLVDVDIIQGRDIWRVTGVHEQQSSLSFVESPWYPLLDRIAILILRLCNGEEAYEELWNDIDVLYKRVHQPYDTNTDIESIEIIVIARMLYYLGYWVGEEGFVLSEDIFAKENFDEVLKRKKELIGRINDGIHSSQL